MLIKHSSSSQGKKTAINGKKIKAYRNIKFVFKHIPHQLFDVNISYVVDRTFFEIKCYIEKETQEEKKEIVGLFLPKLNYTSECFSDVLKSSYR